MIFVLPDMSIHVYATLHPWSSYIRLRYQYDED